MAAKKAAKKKTVKRKAAKRKAPASKMTPEKKIESGFKELFERECNDESCCKPKMHHSCSNGAVYGLGVIGALFYYISTATGFWNGVLGVLKALVWPAILVFEILKYIGL